MTTTDKAIAFFIISSFVFVFGYCFGFMMSTRDHQQKAIDNNCAEYDSKTGEFQYIGEKHNE